MEPQVTYGFSPAMPGLLLPSPESPSLHQCLISFYYFRNSQCFLCATLLAIPFHPFLPLDAAPVQALIAFPLSGFIATIPNTAVKLILLIIFTFYESDPKMKDSLSNKMGERG